ncbi:NAD(P)/FAD-dependent oxidoreductase [Wenxinia marina]|uniref:Putative NAD/FAD-binding protein n=1 Tax=Wenxinia marina DSM 24838 TaxID=1123501 RepID=A0A0D0QA71_9RHOB|nr:FAD-dependent oxidoreductase [Wenxinia marina]KIQ71369.1 putative NAD/FAD-binding protein [Wenxinia marina DSM 24838]GGL81278.1 cyclopropane-fatty-acyl-phospholipid synthase [Wenxinia marina]
MDTGRTRGPRRRIAVIGAGISGMGAARGLAGGGDEVILFEAEKRLGGHARTRIAGPAEEAVDTGFIVYNEKNYPHLTRLFDELGVKTTPSNMSFGASIGGGRIEYGLASLGALFAQRRNMLNPSFLRMCRDILRFNARAERALAETPDATVGRLIEGLRLGPYFRDFYLTPFSGAIWSTPKDRILDFPADALVRFFRNHGLLGTYGQRRWRTVSGGSVEYVTRLGAALAADGVVLRLGAPVDGVRRVPGGAEVKAQGGEWERFDEVILAAHSDDALALLADPSEEERSVLGAIRYQPNDLILHSDASVMPRARQVWSSWCYSEPPERDETRIGLTYWMNSLQPWLTQPMFVTLNATRPVREELIWDMAVMRHPVYDVAAFAAQARAAEMNGTRHTWFCGAWMKNGFHEDGLSSGLDVARALRAAPAMAVAAE